MRPLVLVHGNGAGAESLGDLARALADDFAVVSFARSGWDGADPPPRAGYYRAQGAELAAELAASLSAPADVLGWSSGAFAVLHAALDAPDRFRRVVLYEPPLWSRSDTELGPMLAFLRFLAWGGLGRKVRARRAFWRMVTTRADGRTGYDALDPARREALDTRDGPLLHEVFSGTGEELRGRLGSLEVPVTVLSGAESSGYLRRGSERLCAAVPGAIHQIVEGADHLHPVARPDAFAAALRSALAS